MSPHGTPTGPDDAATAVGGFAIRAGEFNAFRRLILEQAGITLNDSKQQLVASRLARRLRALKLQTYGQYLEHLVHQDPDGSEMREMLNCITTNKTDFFRERHHFEFLQQRVFADLQEEVRRGRPRLLRIWSAGCSSGEEPYTLAMTILAGFPNPVGWRFEIVATDLDTQVLARAREGVYREELLTPVPTELRRRFFRRGTGANAGTARVTQEVRDLVTFEQLNLIERPWPVAGRFDLIFCRNVLIYFERETVKSIVQSFAERLNDGGYLFLGHSESLQSLMDLFEPLRGTVYRLRSGAGSASGAVAAVPPAQLEPTATAPGRPETAPARTAAARATVRQRRARRAAEARVMASAVSEGPGARHVTVTIGGVRASAEATPLRTVLGSCVCACLFDPVARIGGINHFMLPDGLADAELPTRYGVNAMEMLINDIAKLGGDRRRLEAKAFGAAHVLAKVGVSADVPRKNAQFVKEFLEKEGIPLVSSRLGGSAPVEVVFHPTTGRALIRTLGTSVVADLALEETHYDLEIRKELTRPAAGAVVLFDEAA